MRQAAEKFYADLARLIQDARVTDSAGRRVSLFEGIERAGALLMAQAAIGGKVMFIGNGANAGISSHMAADFWKNGGILATAFNDAAQLTALGNDCGVGEMFAMPVRAFGRPGDVLMALSSSGRSPNILRAVEAARQKECKVITLSGFDPDNGLCTTGEYNFYVASHSYALVEVAHHSICHCLLDVIMTKKNSQ